ncbi:MAG: MoxR family ATPase [Crocinitomicaceae bacterium]|nr:MoxR family ATPase [Crocinitomicaceae bacterium]
MKDTEHNNSSNEEEQTEGLNSNLEHKIPDIESVEKESKDTAIDNKSTESPVVDDKFKSSLIDLSPVTIKVEQIRSEMERFIIGQHEMIDLLLIGVFTGGHILLEGVPGVAKTLSARVMAKTISSEFSRIQFTPDMMPSDIIGTSVFNMKTSDFMFKKGPIFTNIVLIDEINRSPAKTQAALFEVMEEKQITYDGTTYPMEFPFLVVATQNPVEQEGTYRLPEAQLDRFLFKVNLEYPTLEEENRILDRYRNNLSAPDISSIKPIISADDIKSILRLLEQIRIEDQLLKYIAEITLETRTHGKLYLGASPRASLSMMKASKALAAMRGRDFVIPDDVQYVAFHVLNHRIILTAEAEMEGMTAQNIIQEIVQKIEVPR